MTYLSKIMTETIIMGINVTVLAMLALSAIRLNQADCRSLEVASSSLRTS